MKVKVVGRAEPGRAGADLLGRELVVQAEGSGRSLLREENGRTVWMSEWDGMWNLAVDESSDYQPGLRLERIPGTGH